MHSGEADSETFLPSIAEPLEAGLIAFREQVNRTAKLASEDFAGLLSSDSQIIALIERDSGVGAYSQRCFKRELRNILEAGVDQLLLPLPLSEAGRIARALESGTFSEGYSAAPKFGIPQSGHSQLSNWASVIQSAYNCGLGVVPIGNALRERGGEALETIADRLSTPTPQRMLLWSTLSACSGETGALSGRSREAFGTAASSTILFESPSTMGSPLRAALCAAERLSRAVLACGRSTMTFFGRRRSQIHSAYHTVILTGSSSAVG